MRSIISCMNSIVDQAQKIKYPLMAAAPVPRVSAFDCFRQFSRREAVILGHLPSIGLIPMQLRQSRYTVLIQQSSVVQDLSIYRLGIVG